MQKKGIEPLPIAIIFPQFERRRFPFAALNQLQEVGLLNIYIVLSKEEYLKAQSEKFTIFDNSKPQTVLEHYQSHSSDNKINFHVLNSGDATTAEEKLSFYLNYLNQVRKNYSINVFASHETLPWVTPALISTLPAEKKQLTNYSFLGYSFLTRESWKDEVLSPSSKSSTKALELLNRSVNPCYCHQIGFADVLNYQWLFNIFVELVLLKISQNDKENKTVEGAVAKLKHIITDYYQNISSLKGAEDSFNATHAKLFATLETTESLTNFWLRSRHERNTELKEGLEKRFPQLITEIISLYQDLDQQLSPSMKSK